MWLLSSTLRGELSVANVICLHAVFLLFLGSDKFGFHHALSRCSFLYNSVVAIRMWYDGCHFSSQVRALQGESMVVPMYVWMLCMCIVNFPCSPSPGYDSFCLIWLEMRCL